MEIRQNASSFSLNILQSHSWEPMLLTKLPKKKMNVSKRQPVTPFSFFWPTKAKQACTIMLVNAVNSVVW